MKYRDRDIENKNKKKKYKVKILPTSIAAGLIMVFGAIAAVTLGGVFKQEPPAQIPLESSRSSSKPALSLPPSSEEIKDTVTIDYSSEPQSLSQSSPPQKPPSSTDNKSPSESVSSESVSSESVSSESVSSESVSSEAVSSEAVSSEAALDEAALTEDNFEKTTEPDTENEDTFFKAPEVPLIEPPIGSPSDWNLILLNHNKYNKIDSELSIDKTKFDSQYVDSRAAKAYEAMYAAAKENGITLFLRSGYRSIKTQNTNYNANIQREIKRGHNKEEAVRLTKLYYTEPGHSEHHTGLAFDIITPQYHKDIYTLSEKFAQTDAYKFMSEHCTEYGFVLRYPKEKQEITAINFEPWHYRYVGVEHAQYMKENNLCLEEYVDLLNYLGR